MTKFKTVIIILTVHSCLLFVQTSKSDLSKQIEPNWESMSENYHVPQWLEDGVVSMGEFHL